MHYSYIFTPFFAWLIAGCCKFLISSIKAKRLAFNLIGYGGLPSNHSTIVSSMAALIGFKNGFDTPAFGVAITLAFIVIMDANSLRRQIGKQAQAINQLAKGSAYGIKLRERMGHSLFEIIAGIILGVTVGFVLAKI